MIRDSLFLCTWLLLVARARLTGYTRHAAGISFALPVHLSRPFCAGATTSTSGRGRSRAWSGMEAPSAPQVRCSVHPGCASIGLHSSGAWVLCAHLPAPHAHTLCGSAAAHASSPHPVCCTSVAAAAVWTGVRLPPCSRVFDPNRLSPCVSLHSAAAVWTGVRLRDVLKAAGLEDDDANVNHIQVGVHTDWFRSLTSV